jgi:hypothetical protein
LAERDDVSRITDVQCFGRVECHFRVARKLLFRLAIVLAGWTGISTLLRPTIKRFLVNARADEAATASITIVERWTAALKR